MGEWHQRIRAAFDQRGLSIDLDVLEELAQHAESTYDARLAEGDSAADALACVDRLIDGWRLEGQALNRVIKRAPAIAPPAQSHSFAAGAMADAIYGLRLLRARPGYAAVTILTIALGVGARHDVIQRRLRSAAASAAVGLHRSAGSSQRDARRHGRPHPRHDDERQLSRLGRGAADARWHRVLQRRKSGDADRRRRADANRLLANVRLRRSSCSAFVRCAGASSPRHEGARRNDRSIGRVDFAGVVATTLRATRRHRRTAAGPRWRAAHDRRRDAARVSASRAPKLASGSRGRCRPSTIRAGPRRAPIMRAIGRLKPGVTTAQAAAEGTARAIAAPDAGPVAMALFGAKAPIQIVVTDAIAAATADVRPAIIVLLLASAAAVCDGDRQRRQHAAGARDGAAARADDSRRARRRHRQTGAAVADRERDRRRARQRRPDSV